MCRKDAIIFKYFHIKCISYILHAFKAICQQQVFYHLVYVPKTDLNKWVKIRAEEFYTPKEDY